MFPYGKNRKNVINKQIWNPNQHAWSKNVRNLVINFHYLPNTLFHWSIDTQADHDSKTH